MTPDNAHSSNEIDEIPADEDHSSDGQELVQLLKKKLPKGDIKRDQLAAILAQVVSVEISEVRKFHGPLPPPEMLQQYEQVQPGLIALITERSGKEQDFRHEMNRRLQDREDCTLRHLAMKTYAGQACAFVLALSGICGGIWLSANDHKVEGLGTVITTVAALAATFITGKITDGKSAKRRQTDG